MRWFSLFVALGTLVSCAKDPVVESGSGGTPGTGGKTGSGGTTSSGGRTSSGGTTSSGGRTGSGGTTSSGGSTQPATIDCPDTSTYTNFVTGQYGATVISVNNNSSKSYYMQANWWGNPPSAPQEEVSGIGFTITGSVSGSGNSVIGYPSIFIGTYGTKRTTSSNLPKAVSALTSVPTIFQTNVDTKGDTSYNAAYDVWFTKGSAALSDPSTSSPGSGGAYLMVWLFKPTDKQPRGTLRGNGTIVSGVKGGWDVWYDPSDPACVSYVASNKAASLEFDLKYFIDDAIANGYGVKSSQYLSIIFAGFEVWAGGDGLQIKHFCANVK
jgi:hypothetical protein